MMILPWMWTLSMQRIKVTLSMRMMVLAPWWGGDDGGKGDDGFTLVENRKACHKAAKKNKRPRDIPLSAYQKQQKYEKKQLDLFKLDEESLSSLVGVMTVVIKGSNAYSRLNA